MQKSTGKIEELDDSICQMNDALCKVKKVDKPKIKMKYKASILLIEVYLEKIFGITF